MLRHKKGKITKLCRKTQTKTPPKCHVNIYKVKVPSWNGQQVSRKLTELQNYIITGVAPRTRITN